MIVERLNDTLDQLLLEASPVRTPGVHLSDVIRSILATTDPGKYGTSGPIDPRYTDPGFTFERVMETAWTSRLRNVVRPGEFTHDGIICSPDGIDLSDPHRPELVEMKLTDMSSVDCPIDPKFRKWLWQMGAYCHVCGLTSARLHALFLRGDYKKERRVYGVWRIQWTYEELASVWLMITGHAREKGWIA